MYTVVLDGFTEQLGPAHADTLRTTCALATMLDEMGEYAEARPLFEAAVEGQTVQLGATHMETLMTKGNLAEMLVRTAGPEDALQLVTAKQMLVSVVDGFSDQLSEQHEYSLYYKSNLGLAHQKLGASGHTPLFNTQEAETIYRQVLLGQEGPEGDQNDARLTRTRLEALLCGEICELTTADT